MAKLPNWVRAKGFDSWKSYMASIRPKHRRRRRRAKRNPIAIYNPKEMRPRLDVSVRRKRARLRKRSPLKGFRINPNPPGRLIYAHVIEIRAEKGPDQIKAGRRFKHRFKRGSAEARALPNGDVLIRAKGGRRLWIPESQL